MAPGARVAASPAHARTAGPHMTPERWQRLTELFESALERAPAERASFLASACVDDPELRDEVERVLESDAHAGSFGESPAFRFAPVSREATLEPGARLGRYEIVDFLAAGG